MLLITKSNSFLFLLGLMTFNLLVVEVCYASGSSAGAAGDPGDNSRPNLSRSAKRRAAKKAFVPKRTIKSVDEYNKLIEGQVGESSDSGLSHISNVLGKKQDLKECSICLENLSSKIDENIQLDCQHEFHRKCIQEWLDSNVSIYNKNMVTKLDCN